MASLSALLSCPALGVTLLAWYHPSAATGGAIGAVAIGLGLAMAGAQSSYRSIRRTKRLAAALDGAERCTQIAESDLEASYFQFVEVMAQALDARDPYTAGHSIRVSAYAREIALELGLPAAEAETIRIAAELHDIGKIGIPDAILQKPGPLTQEEYGLVKLHPQMGRKILERVKVFKKLLAGGGAASRESGRDRLSLRPEE